MSDELQSELREIEALCRRILSSHVDNHPKDVGRFSRRAWSALEAAGLTDLASGFDDEAPDVGLQCAFAVLREASRHVINLPIAEHDLLATWIARQAGVQLEPGAVRTVAVLDEHGVGTVPWLNDVERVLAVAATADGGCRVWESSASSVNVSIDQREEDSRRVARLAVPSEGAVVLDRDLRPAIKVLGALARSVMMSGAAARIVELAIEHVSTREQFGRPISRFQAVQNMMADVASEASLMASAADAAVTTVMKLGPTDRSSEFAVAAAASCVGHAAATVVRNSHQLLGAMGYSQEHHLHIYTNRLLRWRSEYGSLVSWDLQVLRAAIEAGEEGLWPLVAGG